MLKHEPQFKIWFNSELPLIKVNTNFCQFFNQVHEMEMVKKNKTIWGQKTPRFIRHTDFLSDCFGNVKYVFIHRDPRAVAQSFKKSQNHNSSLKYATDRWNQDNKFGLELMRSHPDNVVSTSFERLVCNPKQTLKEIMTFLGLEFEDQMLKYFENGNSEYSKLSGAILQGLNKPIHRNSVYEWKNVISKEDVQYIDYNCQETMSELGYEPLVVNSEPKSISKFDKINGWLSVINSYATGWPEELFYVLFRKTIMSVFSKSLKPFKI